MIRRPLIFAGIVLVLVTGCGGSATPSPIPSRAPGPELTLPELKLALIEAYGPLWYCDPDFYPIQRQDEIDSARERWPEVVADRDAFTALTSRLGMDPDGGFSDDEKLAVYQAWKVLNAIALDPIGNEAYRYDYLAQPVAGAAEGTRTAGTISASGEIAIGQQATAPEPMCPICLARGTAIETPGGSVPVEVLRIGDPVWTIDGRGRRTEGTVIAVGSTLVPAGHQVVRLVLADGRTVTASPGHPLSDGRRLGDLRVGEAVDGSVAIAADLIAYDGAQTYDLAVNGPTGIYLVDGLAMGSTLQP